MALDSLYFFWAAAQYGWFCEVKFFFSLLPLFLTFFPTTSYICFQPTAFFVLSQTRIEQSDDEMSSLSPRQQQTACSPHSHTRYRAAAVGLYLLCIFCVQRGNHKWWLVPPRVPQAGVVFCALYVAWGWTPALSMHTHSYSYFYQPLAARSGYGLSSGGSGDNQLLLENQPNPLPYLWRWRIPLQNWVRTFFQSSLK